MNTKLYEKALSLVRSSDRGDQENSQKMIAVYNLLIKASDKGDPRAVYAIGTWYLHGYHVKKDVKKALPLIRQAAEADVAPAAFDMAIAYEKGIGVKKNESIAAGYYLQALRCGDTSAREELRRLFYWGIGVNKNRRLAEQFAGLVACPRRKGRDVGQP